MREGEGKGWCAGQSDGADATEINLSGTTKTSDDGLYVNTL